MDDSLQSPPGLYFLSILTHTGREKAKVSPPPTRPQGWSPEDGSFRPFLRAVVFPGRTVSYPGKLSVNVVKLEDREDHQVFFFSKHFPKLSMVARWRTPLIPVQVVEPGGSL